MANKSGNDDRSFAGADREREREVSNEPNRPSSSGTRTRSARGFASMDRGKQREIASKGGKAAHAKGTAHEFDSGEAREAGRKGGMAVSRNRDHMAAIGRRGGEARGHARTRTTSPANTQGSNGTQEGAVQNSRNLGEREVHLRAQSNGAASPLNTQGNRGGTSSIGGESRTSGTVDSRDTNPNH